MRKLILSNKAQRPCNWVIQRDALLLHSSFGFVVAIVLQQLTVGLCQSLSTSPHFTRISIPSHRMQRRVTGRVPVMANAPQAVGFKYCNCNGEFGSCRSMECHHRHITSMETHAKTPRSCNSLSSTGRADMSSGILRQHDAATLDTLMRFNSTW